MRIDQIELTHLRIPLKEPFRISGGEVSEKDAILVQVRANGLVGYGESSPMAAGFGYNADTPESCWTDLAERIGPRVLYKTLSTLDEAVLVQREMEFWLSSVSGFRVGG